MTNKIAEIVIFNVAATVGDRVVVAGVVRGVVESVDGERSVVSVVDVDRDLSP